MAEQSKKPFAPFLYDQGDRIGLLKQVLASFGHPDKAFKIIHVCGTNGKGSTSMMIAAVLRQLKFHVGLFTSPAIGDTTNSIQTDFSPVSERVFQDKLSIIAKQMEEPAFKAAQLSEFEALFLAAMLIFAEQGVDYVVLECGLGGELDATNAVSTTIYSIFTEIGLDHLGLLGNSLREIATTKARIIRPGNTTILAQHQQPVTAAVVRGEALRKHATFLSAELAQVHQHRDRQFNQVQYAVQQPKFKLTGQFKFSLKATYQLENLATVITWLSDFLPRIGLITQFNAVLSGALAALTVPGRFEQIATDPVIILDGGHNPDGIRAFVSSVDAQYRNSPKIVVNGFLKDKDYEQAVKSLSKLKQTQFIVTEPINQERELPADSLAGVYQRIIGDRFPQVADPIVAIKMAITEAKKMPKQPIIFVVGSFYLLNPIRTYLLSRSVPDENNTRL